jgi:glutamyl-tRNA reductase
LSTSRACDETARAAAATTLASLRRRADEVRAAELARAERRLRELAPSQLAAVASLADPLVTELLRTPAQLLREPDAASVAADVEFLFGLDEERAA